MKSSKLILGCLATLGLSAGLATAQANVDRDAIAERIKPVGELCLQGEECGSAAAAPAQAANGDNGNGGELDGAALYTGSGCAACHASGVAGAPILGDADGWAARLEQGTETLYDHAINGLGAMPAKGGNPGLSDDEVKAIVDYMIAEVQ